MQELIALPWPDYELLDSGNRQRLERYGAYTLVRPDPNVLWQVNPSLQAAWEGADAHFLPGASEDSNWQASTKLLKGWNISRGNATFFIKPTSFRHVGLFPEQSTNWDWLEELIHSVSYTPKVLNLFAYTGAASVGAALAGAEVCHVDASKGSTAWAKDNAALSGLPEDAIRWIVDDVRKFMQREIRRGKKYDIILMDPPVFGRGPKGEIWRLEEELVGLFDLCRQLLSEKPLGLLVNFYATALYPDSVLRLAQDEVGDLFPSLMCYSLSLQESNRKMGLATGYCLRT
jgi:23S rRNA (cytosine1962-C5)-methyltransferase